MGQEFAYPKKQAIEIANAAHTGVLAVDTESENYDAQKAGEISRVEPGAGMAQHDNAATTQSSASHGTAAAVATPAENQQAARAAQPSQPQSADVPSAKPEPANTPAVDQTPTSQPVGTSGNADADMPPGHIAKGVGTSGAVDADMPEGHVAKGVGTSGTLPHTASPLPLIGLAGVLALFAAAGVRALRKAVV
jgi:hypothetical protein